MNDSRKKYHVGKASNTDTARIIKGAIMLRIDWRTDYPGQYATFNLAHSTLHLRFANQIFIPSNFFARKSFMFQNVSVSNSTKHAKVRDTVI